jgi:hypothetical protein
MYLFVFGKETACDVACPSVFLLDSPGSSVNKGESVMRRMISLAAVLCCLAWSLPAVAGDEGTKGASSKAYEHASERSIFNRAGDWFATVGRSDEEKAAILQERSETRAAKRAEKEARKTERAAREEAKQAESEAEEAAEALGYETKGGGKGLLNRGKGKQKSGRQ